MADDLLADEIHAAQQAGDKALPQQKAPFVEDKLELPLQRIGRGPGGRHQQLHQGIGILRRGAEGRLPPEESG